MEIKHILIVRFRQMGDAIMATPLISTLKRNYPDATIDFVLNERIAPLFKGHPAISHIHTFTDEERHHPFTYIKKVWHIVREKHYDVIIDMRSTTNTMLFAMLSPSTPYRIGLIKPYTRFIFNFRIQACQKSESMIDHNLMLAEPLGIKDTDRLLSLPVTKGETEQFRAYMQKQGIDFARPVMLAGVTAKLEHKTWPEEYMTQTLTKLQQAYPDLQIIFNYAPGKEAENALRIYESLPDRHAVFMNIEAKSPRELAALSSNCTFYFGNEGGARHIVHAVGRPSFVVCGPSTSRTTWIPQDNIPAVAVAPAEQADAQTYATLTHEQRYALVTPEVVWPALERFIQHL